MAEPFRGMPVLDGALHFGQPFAARHEAIRRAALDRFRVAVPPADAPCAGDALPARVDANRWLVDCPDCGSAEYAFVDDPRFFCSECLNAAVGAACRPVAFPRERAAIEAVLRARPVPRTREWWPGETVADLERENAEHGLGVRA